jgi:hypothetical protein
MKSLLRISAPVLLALVVSAHGSASFAAGPNQPVALPKEAKREVIGTWRLRDSKCTRSIEQVAEQFYIVARCRQPADIDGSVGVPLTRISDKLYRNLSGVHYEIQGDGHLLVKVKDEVFDRGVPQSELWPE